MQHFNILKEELQQVRLQSATVLLEAKTLVGGSASAFAAWEKTLQALEQQMAEEVMRVAVVGPIKSGKSTFLNALLKADHLKRGAGVITSIVTRVHCGEALEAKLVFKSWDEVNAEMEQAMVLFPSTNWRPTDEDFDIRRKGDRRALAQAFASLQTELLITNDARDPNSVLLSCYLNGYEAVKDLVSGDTAELTYHGDEFSRHHAFTGDENLAVFLKDIQLEIDSQAVDGTIEIADCQGSDSSNPLHLAMVQDYLLLTHLIVYVISSRTGLRQADIRFLSMIKKMGLLDSTLFVINCDFSEHETLEDLTALVEKSRGEIALIKAAPEVYCFSALFNLFRELRRQLPEKDRLRLQQWEAEQPLADFSEAQTAAFLKALEQRLTRKRSGLLLKNHAQRLDVVLTGIGNWLRINRDLISGDARKVGEIARRVKDHREHMDRIRNLVANTLAGAKPALHRELKSDIDRFYETDSNGPARVIGDFIRNYRVDYSRHEQNLRKVGFAGSLYRVYQEFKQALDGFLAETVNPEIVRFIRDEEAKIDAYFSDIGGPFEAMISEAYAEYHTVMRNLGVGLGPGGTPDIELPDVGAVKAQNALKPPALMTFMRYTAKTKTEAFMRLGFYTLLRGFRRLLRKAAPDKRRDELRALKDGVARMKKETARSLRFHIKDSRENLKFKYLVALVETMAEVLQATLSERFEAYATDLSAAADLIDNRRVDKGRAQQELRNIEERSSSLRARLERIQMQIAAEIAADTGSPPADRGRSGFAD